MANACAMVRRCMERQNVDPDYTISTHRGLEAADAVYGYVPPTDAGIHGHAADITDYIAGATP